MSGLSYQAGHVIGERYRLESKLGEGGMGEVWRAEHVALKSPVAIKFINPSLAASSDALNRFMLEARSSAALRSTHIVQVFDFGVEDGVPYIAMELLHGESLGDRLERVGRLSVGETARIMAEVARAVDHAHSAGVVHRDLKPDNIFLVREGSAEIAKVLDFGIAKVTGGGLDATTNGSTRTGAILGTPFYVSPEQARGNKRVDHRSDVWALGVITYQCVVGSLPFMSDGLGDLLMQICGDPHAPPSMRQPVPAGFDEWAARALAKDADARFQSASEMFAEFTALVAGSQPGLATPGAFVSAQTMPHPITPTPSGPFESSLTPSGVTAASAPQKSAVPILVLGGLGFGVLLAMVGGGVWLFSGRASADADASADVTQVPPAPTALAASPEPASPEPATRADDNAGATASAQASASAPQTEAAADPAPPAATTAGGTARKPRAPSPRTATTKPATAKPASPPEPATTKPRSGADLFEDRR